MLAESVPQKYILNVQDIFKMNRLEKIAIQASTKIYRKLIKSSISTNSIAKNRELGEAYYRKQILSLTESGQLLNQSIISDSPIMISRFGATELECISNFLDIRSFNEGKRGLKRIIFALESGNIFWKKRTKHEMFNSSGFFPTTDKMLERFSIEFLEHTKNIDILGIWYLPNENEIINNYCPDATLIKLGDLPPWRHEVPWSKFLEGKRVLVIHPFAESIKKQYQKRHLLFDKPEILPKFELTTIRAIQSLAGNQTGFSNWFDAYDYMCGKIADCNFDIAIIGAGAYGLPLASFVKSLGKKAVHLGGVTQILFGIKGSRWEKSKKIEASFFNEHWSYPLPSETPSNFQNVEGGKAPYW
jgi:hypothetical protein